MDAGSIPDTPGGHAAGRAEEPTSEEGLSAAVEQIEAFVESDSTAVLEKALDRHLTTPLTEETFRAVRDAGMLVVGEDGFGLVIWVVSKPEPARALDALDLSPAVRDWLTGIVAIYGYRLNRALHLSDVLASRRDDWESFGWTVRLRPGTGEYEISTEIRKYNGEKLTIEAGLPSLVRLAERTLEPLVSVETLTSVDDDDRAALLEALEAVHAKLTLEGPQIAAEEGE